MKSFNDSVEKFQTPNTDADIEKRLLAVFKFTKKRNDDSYDVWPDDEIHTIYITHSAYEMAIENFKHSVERVVKTFESKGYELTDDQKKLAVKGLLDSYKYNSLTPDDRESYTAAIMEAVYMAYEADGIFNEKNKFTGFSDKFSTTKSVIDYLAASGKYAGYYGKVEPMSKAKSVVHKIHKATSVAYKSLNLELRQMNYREKLINLSGADEHEELRKAMIEYMKK